ncbi:MAG: hypothetical protein HY574_12135 [candidate division NC10 bacterium]|nr:hypothetical protein [candidate division NC10 bacterium]
MAILFRMGGDLRERRDAQRRALGLPGLALLLATVVAVIVGTVYALSPMTVWFGLAMALLLTCAGTGLPDGERRWVLSLLVVALFLRLLVIAGFFLLADHDHHSFSFFFGDESLAIRRSLLMRNTWLWIPIPPDHLWFVFDRGYGWTGYHYVLAYLQVLLGPAPYGVHLFNAGLFLAGAVALHRMVRRAYGPLPALGGLLVLLFLPSLFLWSISALKESLYFFLMAMALVGTVKAVRASNWSKRLLAIAVSVGAIGAISTVRAGGFVTVVFGIVSGLVARFATLRVWLFMAFLIFSSIVGRYLVTRSDIQDQIMGQLRRAAIVHLGNVRTQGHAYKLLDQRFYSEGQSSIPSMTPPEALRFVVRAAVSFVAVPLPWQTASSPMLVFLPQQIVWYALVVLAAAGFLAGLRRDALVTFILAGCIFVGAGVIALHSGNFGSLVRFRDTVVPSVVWLSALGMVSVLFRLTSRYPVGAPEGGGGRRQGIGKE